MAVVVVQCVREQQSELSLLVKKAINHPDFIVCRSFSSPAETFADPVVDGDGEMVG